MIRTLAYAVAVYLGIVHGIERAGCRIAGVH